MTLITTLIGSTVEAQQSLAWPRTAVEMLEVEQRRRALGLALSDLFLARDIVSAHRDGTIRAEAAAQARQRYLDAGVAKTIESRGQSPVVILLPGGLSLKMHTPYVLPSRKGRRGRKRGSGKRGPGGTGCYPVLELLGINCGATPLTRSLVSRQAVLCSSFSEAREQLARDGLDLDISTLVRLTRETGEKATELRDEALTKALSDPLPERSMVAGQRIRVSLDGGRARTRRTFRKARKGKNGRRPFTLDWREPRVITVDVLDEEGRKDRSIRPIYEVSIREADRVFDVLCGLLRLIGANQAALLVFVADGAEWIWNRAEELFERAGVSRERVELVLDFYHATEHIFDILKVCANLKPKQRLAFHRFFSKEMLEEGGPARVIGKLKGFARGRRGKKVNKEIAYLEGHLEHMRYFELRSKQVPIGSGVVESAVKRVVNYRFKGASRCWCEEGLEGLMYLRAILMSGRWDDAMRSQLERRHFLPLMTQAPSPRSTSSANFACSQEIR